MDTYPFTDFCHAVWFLGSLPTFCSLQNSRYTVLENYTSPASLISVNCCSVLLSLIWLVHCFES